MRRIELAASKALETIKEELVKSKAIEVIKKELVASAVGMGVCEGVGTYKLEIKTCTDTKFEVLAL